MKICWRCHQPITSGSTRQITSHGYEHVGTELPGNGGSHNGCPSGNQQIIDNLMIAMGQTFKPEFCRTHYINHK